MKEAMKVQFQPYAVRRCPECGQLFCKDVDPNEEYDPEESCDSCSGMERYMNRVFEQMLRTA